MSSETHVAAAENEIETFQRVAALLQFVLDKVWIEMITASRSVAVRCSVLQCVAALMQFVIDKFWIQMITPSRSVCGGEGWGYLCVCESWGEGEEGGL